MKKALLPDTTWNLLYPPRKVSVKGGPATPYAYFEGSEPHAFREQPASPQDVAVDAWWLAESSLLVYEDAVDVTAVLGAAGFLEPALLSSRGTQASVARWGESAVVCFRGTEADETVDLLTDLDVALEKLPGDDALQAHRGFVRALDRIWGEVAARLEAMQPKDVFFTGHSLGAALATLAVLRCRLAARLHLFTFASPASGNARLAQAVLARAEGRCRRFVNAQDLVTLVPPGTVYTHVGEEHFIDVTGRVRTGWSDQQKWENVVWEQVSHDTPILGPVFDRLITLLDRRAWCNPFGYLRNLGALRRTMTDKNAPPLYLLGNHSPARYSVHAWNNL